MAKTSFHKFILCDKNTAGGRGVNGVLRIQSGFRFCPLIFASRKFGRIGHTANPAERCRFGGNTVERRMEGAVGAERPPSPVFGSLRAPLLRRRTPEIQPATLPAWQAFPSLGAAAVPHAPKPKASCQPHPSRRFSCSQIRPPRLCPSRDSPKIHPPRGWNPRPPCCSRISPIRGASSLKPPKVLGGGPCLSYSMPRCLSYSLASIKPPLRGLPQAPLRGLAFPPWPRFPPCRRLPLLRGPASPCTAAF